MANNVDLMVVGAADGVSADELTQRLVSEFGQPAEAFTELVAAACGSGNKYAAQSSVTLDTAVEGQAKLEDLGVVCELLVGGEVVSSSGFSNPAAEIEATAPEPEAPADETAIELQTSVDAVDASDIDVEEPASSDAPEEVISLDIDEKADDLLDAPSDDNSASETADDADDGLPAENGLDIVAVSFDDELGSLGTREISTDTQPDDSDSEGLESVEIDFNDELDSLEDLTIEKEDNKPQAQEQTSAVAEVLKEDTKADAGQAVAEQAEPAEESVEQNIDKISLDDIELTDEAATPGPVAEKPEQAAGKPAEEPLELTLAVDDSAPLTKPKKKSDSKPDDGGLTLVLDDEPATTAPVQDLPTQTITDAAAETDLAAKPQAASDETSDITLEAESPELRDTSREPVEITPPIAVPEEEAEPEPKPDSAESEDNTTESSADKEPSSNIADLADSLLEPEKQTPAESPATVTAEAQLPDTTEQSATAETDAAPKVDDLTSFIDSLASDDDGAAGGGLVLPGQAATASKAAPEAPVVASAETAATAGGEDAPSEAAPSAADVVDLSLPDTLAPEIYSDDSESSGKSKKKVLALAAAALGAVGVGGLVALQSGFLNKTVEPTTTVVAVTPIKDDSAEFDAVEEVSLNAAIERTAVLKNPDKYTTEELIVYLAEDLGENAKNELKNYVTGGADYKSTSESAVPRMGAAIPADSDSELWLRNRVDHPADKYFDEWSKREVDLQAYLELQDRLIDVGDLDIALDVSSNTRDKLFAVMSQQRLARAYHELGKSEKASEVLAMAVRGTYAIELESERVLAIADYALTELALGYKEDAADSFLKASILSRSLHKPQNRTVAFSAIAEYFHKAKRNDDALDFLNQAMTTAYELPVNTAARDLAIRHVALTEVRLGLTEQATEHANLIVDPFAAVSALHGIALELERTGDEENARHTLNMAYRAGSLIRNSDKREKLLEKIRLAGN